MPSREAVATRVVNAVRRLRHIVTWCGAPGSRRAGPGRPRVAAPVDVGPVHVWVDEIQPVDGASSANLAGLLEQSANYGGRLHTGQVGR
jgi:hypothetical protein